MAEIADTGLGISLAGWNRGYFLEFVPDLSDRDWINQGFFAFIKKGRE